MTQLISPLGSASNDDFPTRSVEPLSFPLSPNYATKHSTRPLFGGNKGSTFLIKNPTSLNDNLAFRLDATEHSTHPDDHSHPNHSDPNKKKASNSPAASTKPDLKSPPSLPAFASSSPSLFGTQLRLFKNLHREASDQKGVAEQQLLLEKRNE